MTNMTKYKIIPGNRIIILKDKDKKVIVNPVDISHVLPGYKHPCSVYS